MAWPHQWFPRWSQPRKGLPGLPWWGGKSPGDGLPHIPPAPADQSGFHTPAGGHRREGKGLGEKGWGVGGGPLQELPWRRQTVLESKGRAKTIKIILQVHLDQIPSSQDSPHPAPLVSSKAEENQKPRQEGGGEPWRELFVPVLGPRDPWRPRKEEALQLRHQAAGLEQAQAGPGVLTLPHAFLPRAHTRPTTTTL